MDYSDGPVVIKSCVRCKYLSFEYDEQAGENGYREIALCEHPVRLEHMDNTMILDQYLVTPDDCPADGVAETIELPEDDDDAPDRPA